jgi:chromosome partitioning protein
MATTLCFINQKGGCGKSSSCFHLAGCFAGRGLSVLLVDVDPQGSLSQALFGSAEFERLEPEETISVVFDEAGKWASLDAVRLPTLFERISLIPANHSLACHNTPSPELSGMKQQTLRCFLEPTQSFDIVLIDCPPNLYLCSWNAMLAADYVVIPVPPEDFGTQGLRVVHQAVDNARRLNPSLQLLGHVVTRRDSRLLVHQAYEKRLRSLYGDRVLQTVIPEASAFKVALACRQPVSVFSPRSKAAKAAVALCDEILERAAEESHRQEVA